MRFRYYLLALLIVFFWGLSLAFTRLLLDNNFTPNLITFLRFSLAILMMVLFLKKKIRAEIERRDVVYFILMALCGTTLFYYFENSALKFTTVSNTALITALIPLFTLLTARILFAKKIHWQNYLGIIAGITGTAVLFYRDLIITRFHLKGDLMALGSVLMWVVYSFALGKVLHRYSMTFIVFRVFTYGVLFLLPVIILEKAYLIRVNIGWDVAVSLIFLAFFCSFLGYYGWNLAIRKLGIKVVSNFILFIPVVSILTGIVLFRESFHYSLVISSLLIISGAYLNSLSQPGSQF
ncbi:MAG: DMT family transporter [Candidatus Cloacimonetes bacterium]|nr:DMT family transporter [Candidatus Cloacimonadota bacterium]